MNKTILLGRLTADPDVRYTQANVAFARFTLAVDRRDKEKTTDFIPCIAWEKKAEFAEKYLSKGMKVIIAGRIQTGSYTNKDGQRVNTTDIVIEDIEFAESKKAEKKELDIPEDDPNLPFN